ncbi:MAG: hypothetical protein JST92_02075, partial [Deltaproteobacteria bacterium]|nr:hypothetical protein [Deltaproteobacteria bacterium]
MRANTTSLWLVASQASLRALVALTLAAAACGDPIEDAKRQALDAAIARATAVGVAPRVDCVIDHSGGRYTAYFGWRNDGASVSQAIGPLNGFAPGAQDRGQPTTFPRGQSRAAPNSPVIFDFDGAPVTWTLLTATATATSGSPRCADTAAPVWPHGSTLTATGLADGSVKLDWTAATDAAYVAKYRVFANGRQLLELDGAATTVTTSLLEAAHDYTLAVQAGDPNGNWSTSGPTAVFDLNPPVVTVTGVSDGLVTRSSVTPVITATDDLLVSARTLLDGQAFTSGATVVAEGTHKLDVLAKDQGGHSTRVLLTFIIDRTPPLLRISGATDGSRIRTFPRISIVSTDANAGTTTVRLDGVTLPDAQPFTVSTEGAHQVQATAVDRAGNASQAQLSFFIDRTPPGVSILAPADRAVVAPGELEVIAAVSDDGPLGAVTLNQQLMTLEGDGSWHGTVALTRGSNLLQVRASDIAGNSSTARVRVTVDTQPPVLTVTSPAEGARIAALTVPLKGKATDASPLTVTVSGAPVTLAADGTFSSTVALVAGTNAITILASDSAGNATTVVRHVRANVTPPTIAFTSPAADGYTNQTSLTVTGVAQPADPSDLVTVKVNGTAVPVDVHGVFSRTVTIGAGTTTIMAVATDGFGLTSTAVLRLGQDRAAPIIELTGAKDGLL